MLRERERQRRDHRREREQEEADEPGRDEQVAPQRLATREGRQAAELRAARGTGAGRCGRRPSRGWPGRDHLDLTARRPRPPGGGRGPDGHRSSPVPMNRRLRLVPDRLDLGRAAPRTPGPCPGPGRSATWSCTCRPSRRGRGSRCSLGMNDSKLGLSANWMLSMATCQSGFWVNVSFWPSKNAACSAVRAGMPP